MPRRVQTAVIGNVVGMPPAFGRNGKSAISFSQTKFYLFHLRENENEKA
jgi:hypothetical protein